MLGCCLWVVVGVAEFVARVFSGGKVTVPKRLREVLAVADGDYVRLAVVEVLKREGATWVRKSVQS